MRKLMWFALGFTGACAVGAYLFFNYILLIFGGISLLLGIGCAFVPRKVVHIIAAVLIGLAVGFGWIWSYQYFYLDTARAYDAKTVETTVQICDYSYQTEFGIGADGKIILDGKAFNIRIYVMDVESLAPGDRVTGSVELRFTAAGGKETATYHQGNGTFLLGYADEGVAVDVSQSVPNRYIPAKWRRTVLDRIDRIFPEDTIGFAHALLLGDSNRLTYGEDVDFQRSGIRHIIAVSGLHISILFSLVYLLTGRKRFFTAILGIPVLIFFAAIAGFTPSVVRACIMQGLIILSVLLNREYDPPTALATAVLVMLLANPVSVTSVSFQLSVGCMIGIFLLCRKIYDYLLRGKLKRAAKGNGSVPACIRWVVGSVSVSLSATVITLPLSAIYFGAVSVVGVLTNILTLWVVSFIFYGIMLACVFGFFWLPAAKIIAWCVSWLMRYVMLMARVMSAIPFAAVYTQSVYVVVWIIFAYVLIAVFLLMKKKQPKCMAMCLLSSLLLAMAFSWLEPRMDDYRVTVLDVGQGQCILLQSKSRTYMVDCGGSNATITADSALEELYSQGVHKIDGLILTHFDRDHANATEKILSRLQVKQLYLPYIQPNSPYHVQLEGRDGINWICEDMVLTDKNIKITLYPGPDPSDPDERCMCVLFQTEKCDILITGDRGEAGERDLLEKTALPSVDVLVAGHHGSEYSTSNALLSAIKPHLVVVSADEDAYNMPSDDLLKRLQIYGIPVRCTSWEGTIIIRG